MGIDSFFVCLSGADHLKRPLVNPREHCTSADYTVSPGGQNRPSPPAGSTIRFTCSRRLGLIQDKALAADTKILDIVASKIRSRCRLDGTAWSLLRLHNCFAAAFSLVVAAPTATSRVQSSDAAF
jgi:hypothetical protein